MMLPDGANPMEAALAAEVDAAAALRQRRLRGMNGGANAIMRRRALGADPGRAKRPLPGVDLLDQPGGRAIDFGGPEIDRAAGPAIRLGQIDGLKPLGMAAHDQADATLQLARVAEQSLQVSEAIIAQNQQIMGKVAQLGARVNSMAGQVRGMNPAFPGSVAGLDFQQNA